MLNQQDDKKKDNEKKEPALKPDPETLHTTDPQEEMKGPISSLIQNIKEGGNHNNESKEEADKRKDESM